MQLLLLVKAHFNFWKFKLCKIEILAMNYFGSLFYFSSNMFQISKFTLSIMLSIKIQF